MSELNRQQSSIGRAFGIPDAPQLEAAPFGADRLTVTRLRRAVAPDEAPRVVIPAADAYFLMLYLADARHCDRLADGSRTAVRLYRQGTVCLVDLDAGASIELASALDALAFVVPRSLIDDVARLVPTRAGRLACRRGVDDPTIACLGSAFAALAECDRGAPGDVLRPMAIALCAHLLHVYDPSARTDDRPPAAAEAPVPDWLGDLRLSAARSLLADHGLPVAAVASLCGFADEAGFADAFRRSTGLGPEAWRRRLLQ